MGLIKILFATIIINLTIEVLLFKYWCRVIKESFEIQDEYNNLFEKYVIEILDIINYNGLVRKPEMEEKK